MTSVNLVHISGLPGVGKSSSAYALQPRIDATVLDFDIAKNVLLEFRADFREDARCESRAADRMIVEFTKDLITQGRSVIIPSMCRSRDHLALREFALSRSPPATYTFIDCFISQDDDFQVVAYRLKTRVRRPCQIQSLDEDINYDGNVRSGRDTYRVWQSELLSPDNALAVDTRQPVPRSVQQIVEYIACRGGKMPE